MDIIMLSLSRSDGPYSSTSFCLAKELSRKNRVFHIDNPFTVKDVLVGLKSKQIRRRLSSFLRGRNFVTTSGEGEHQLVCMTPPLIVPINFLPAGVLYDKLAAFNEWIVFQALKRLKSEYDIKDFIFMNVYNPFYGQKFPRFFRPRMFIYYSIDHIGESLYVSKHGPRLESVMLRKAQATLATSTELLKAAQRQAADVYYLPNAAELELFIRNPLINIERPAEFESITTPIIIYTGHIDIRVDYDLIKSIARNHPDKTLVMVGPHSIDQSLYDELKAIPNIRFLGRRDLAQLAPYLHHSHCAIIPFKCNELTKSIYPLKVNEYLAAGLPVVATAFSEDIQTMRDVVDIAQSEEDFNKKISAAILNDGELARAERVKIASRNKWENRAQRFWEIVGKYTAVPPHLNSMAPMS